MIRGIRLDRTIIIAFVIILTVCMIVLSRQIWLRNPGKYIILSPYITQMGVGRREIYSTGADVDVKMSGKSWYIHVCPT